MSNAAKRKLYHAFSEDIVDKAVKDIKENNLTYRQGEDKYGIPKSTLARWCTNKQTKKFGRPPVLSEDEEKKVVDCLTLAAKWGFPLTKSDLKIIIKRGLDSKGIKEKRFFQNKPGSKWVRSFLKRQKDDLKVRFCHNIKRTRASLTPELLNEYFRELQESIADVPPQALLNYDETSMQDNCGKNKVIIRRTCKRPEKIRDTSKSCYTVMFAGTASGHTLPVYIVYKSTSILYHSWMEGGQTQDTTGPNLAGLRGRYLGIALPYFKRLGDGTKAIIGDNLASHISIRVLEECMKNDIRFILLPPNSTHLCQPLDLTYFSPLKAAWRKVLNDYKDKYRGPIPKDKFPRKLKQALDILSPNSEKNLKAGFKACGIFPLNPQAVLKHLPQDSDNETVPEWQTSFESFLQETRKSQTQTSRKRKKVNNVIPGKSLSHSDVINTIIEKKGKKSEAANRGNNSSNIDREQPSTSGLGKGLAKKKKKNRTIYDLSESSEEDDIMSFRDSSSDGSEDFSDLIAERRALNTETGEDQYETNSGEQEDDNLDAELSSSDRNSTEYEDVELDSEQSSTNKTENCCENLELGNFVFVTLKYNKGSKKECNKSFIAKVENLQTDDTKVLLKFMRNYKGSKNSFIFPVIEDLLAVSISEIVKVIKSVSVVREIYTFNL